MGLKIIIKVLVVIIIPILIPWDLITKAGGPFTYINTKSIKKVGIVKPPVALPPLIPYRDNAIPEEEEKLQ